jgi:NitT/TauT family transport system substrate-binding protein
MPIGRARIVLGTIAVVALALLAVQPASLMEWAHLGAGGSGERLRLAAYEGDVGALEWIAHEKDFFGKVGLSVEMKGYASGKEAMVALNTGLVDVATASDFVVVAGSFTDPELQVLGNISCYRNKGIVGRRDRGIAKPADLKDKRIGLTSPSGAEYTLHVFLARNGLTDKDVTTVNLLPQGIVDAMTRGSIDAAITWQPHVQALQAGLGADGVTFEGSVSDVYLLLVTHKDVLAAKDKAMTKLLRALVLAEEWARSNPEQAKALIAGRFGLDAAAVEAQWRRMQLAVTLPQELPVAMDGEARWLAKRDGKTATAIPNYSTFVASEALRNVKPSAVTLSADTGPTSGVRVPAAVDAR